MADSITFYGIRDKNSAGNASLNVDASDKIVFHFTSGATGDLLLDHIPDGPDGNTLPEIDPDTKIVINGISYDFAVILKGVLPTTNPNGAQKVPDLLEGKAGLLIKIDINGNGLDANDPQYFFTLDGSGDPVVVGNWGNGAVNIALVPVPPSEPVCFCAGTEIDTPSGPRRVETLRPGDSVVTDDGRIAQIAWAGASTYTAAHLMRDAALRPVRLPAHVFGRGLPLRDLDVSPQHRVVVEGAACELLFGMPRAFVVARHLLGTVAYNPKVAGDVTYVHLLLERHEILLGNGLPSESFQPARRMLEIMTADSRDRLMAVLEVLGAEAMLSRPDALPTLTSREAAVLLHGLATPQIPPVVTRHGAACNLH